jgi:hypothetical protein
VVTYEITAAVRADLCGEYERYMSELHIPHLLETGAFASATFSRSSQGRYRIRYEAHSRNALDDYLENHASRLREHFAQAFPEGVQVSREEWEVLASCP